MSMLELAKSTGLKKLRLKMIGSRVISLGLLSVLGVTAASAATIVVYGGTGNIGSRIVTEALNRGHNVTVVSRTGKAHQEGRLNAIEGDILNAADVAKVIAGKDVVISVVNNREASFFTDAAKSVVTALRQDGKAAPRLIWLGGASSLEVEPGKRLLDTTPGATGSRLGHTQVLDYLRTINDVKWTFVSPSMDIRPGQRTGKFRIGGDQLLKDAKGDSRISIEDFAVAIVDEIEKPQQLQKRFTVGY